MSANRRALTEQEAEERRVTQNAAREAAARADGRVSADDVRVLMPELEEIWKERPAFNGMTGNRLRQRYGDRVYHVLGVGWFVRPESAGGEGSP